MASVQRSRIGVCTYLAPSDSLNDAARVAELREAVEDCVDSGDVNIVIDLSGVSVVNSEALGLFLDTKELLTRSGGEVRITGPNRAVRDVFSITGLADHIGSIDPDTDDEASRQTVAGAGKLRIGEILVAKGLVSQDAVDRALKVQSESGRRLAEILVDDGAVEERELLMALSEQLAVPFVALRAGVYDPLVACMIEQSAARRLRVMPLFRLRDQLFVATAEPQSVPTIDTIEDLTGLRVQPVLAVTQQILTAIIEAHSQDNDLAEYLGDLDGDLELLEAADEDHETIDQMASGSPVINLINGLIQRAVRDGASDIHIERSRTRCRVRLRVDGVLYTVMTPPLEIHPALVSRLKVMANLDIAERRLPQDGRLQVVTKGRVVDLRFSSLPGIYGEKLVLRVLDKAKAILEIDRLGLSDPNEQSFRGLLGRTHGLLLVTGPTGSGKTTSLYAALSHMNSSEKNIVTIEDPVEYQLEGPNQNQVKEGIGLGFAKILKHVLRQDPDIVMVGEIRERETAEIAVQAALTGHLVLSTLHTNDAVGAITRLVDMGIEPFLLSSALVGVMGQRLVRTICEECTTSYVVPAATLEQHGLKLKKNARLKRGRGCSSCYDSGYKGRMAIHEIIECDPGLQRLIVSNPARDELAAYLEKAGIRGLFEDGLDRALAGQTTLEEILRVVSG